MLPRVNKNCATRKGVSDSAIIKKVVIPGAIPHHCVWPLFGRSAGRWEGTLETPFVNTALRKDELSGRNGTLGQQLPPVGEDNWKGWLPWLAEGTGAPFPPGVVPLFCFPYAGGGSWIFARWPKALDARFRVFPVVLPGREHRLAEPLPHSIEEIVSEWIRVTVPLLGQNPFVLFGHSFGALVVFEITRQLARAGLAAPQLVIVSGCRAPTLPRTWSPIHHLPEEKFCQEVERRFGVLPPQLRRDPKAFAIYLRILRADLKAVETYEFKPAAPVMCPFAVFGGREDPFVPVMDLFDWADLTVGECRIELFPGGHFFLREHQQLFLKALKSRLEGLRLPAAV
jgi:medium-chain acyl-[acyl-carrier-protein] hydrolase